MKIIDKSLSRFLISVLIAGMVSELVSIQTEKDDSDSLLFGFVLFVSFTVLTVINFIIKKKNSKSKKRDDELIDNS